MQTPHDTPGREPGLVFYAKVYATATASRHAYETLQALRDEYHSSRARFSTAAPIMYAEESRTVVQSMVPGIPLLKVLRRHQDPLPAVRIAAIALANLHRLDLDAAHLAYPGIPRSLETRLERLGRAGQALSSARPDLAEITQETVDTVISGLSERVLAPIHGDLKPDHLLIDGQNVSIIDFDYLHASDPMLDVATMETNLQREETRRHGGRGQKPALAQAFVEAYFAHAPGIGRNRLSLIHAMSSLSEAARCLQSDETPGSRDQVAELTRRAQALLNSPAA